MPTIVAFTGFEFGTAVGAGAGPFDGTTGTVGTDFDVVADPAVVGAYSGRVLTLNNKGYFWNTTTLGASKTALVVSRRFKFTTLPTAANDFTSIDVAASSDRAGFYYDPADQKVHAWITSATQASSFTIAANTWYTLQFRFDCSANPNTLDWTLNGTSQTQVTNALGSSTIARYELGNRGGTGGGVIEFDDVVVSVTAADYPLPMYQVRLVGVDTGGTTTEIGTANATVRFTANGTLDGTHNSAAILTALSELPPLLGSTSSGVAQQTAGAGNAVEVPMANYTLTGGETIAYTRIYLAGWAASALAANLGLRAWNGTAETILHGDTVATGFDSTTNGAWYAFLYTGVTDQTTLNALTVRMGYSTDVSPIVGAHAIYAELLILPGAGGASIGDGTGGGAGAGGGTEGITTVLNDTPGGGSGAGGVLEKTTVALNDLPGGAAGGGTGPEGLAVGLADTAGGGAGAGGVLGTIATVLSDAAGGGAGSSGTGPELNGSSLNDLPGGGAGAGAISEATATVLVDAPGGGVGAGGASNGTSVALQDAAGGGTGAGGALEQSATALADIPGGAGAGGSGPEGETSGSVPVTLNDIPGGAGAGGTIEVPASSEVEHDTMVMPVLNAMLECLTALQPVWPNAPAAYQLRSGNTFVASADSAMDECCAGIVWVRMGVAYPTDDFPIQKTTVENGVETDWAIPVEIGVQRCIPTQGDDGIFGSVVTGAQWAAVVQQEADDGHMLRKAACCLRDNFTYANGLKMGNSGMIIGVQTPLENSGPCGGIMLMLTVRVPACDCPGVG